MQPREHKLEGQIRLPDYYYSMPEELKRPFEIRMDPRSIHYARKGDADALRIYDRPGYNGELAAYIFGQRYVGIAVFINGICHIMLLPSFDFDEATELLPHTSITEAFLNQKISQIMDFFSTDGHKCERRHIVMPDHSVLTGIVHRSIKSLFEEENKALLAEAKGPVRFLSFSARKRGDVFEITNRAAFNSAEAPLNIIPAAFFLYSSEEIKDIAIEQPRIFTFNNFLRRSMKEHLTKTIGSGMVGKIYPDKEPSKYINFNACEKSFECQKDWKELQQLMIDKPSEAIEIIHHALIRNLYIFLFVGAKELKDQQRDDIINGLKEVEKWGIDIDYQYIPPDIASHPLAHVMQKIVIDFAKNIKNKDSSNIYSRPLIFHLVEKGMMSEVNTLLKSGIEANQVDSKGVSLIELASQNRHFDIALMLYDRGATLDSIVKEVYFPLLQYAFEKGARLFQDFANIFGTLEGLIMHLIQHDQAKFAEQIIKSQPLAERQRLANLFMHETLESKSYDTHLELMKGLIEELPPFEKTQVYLLDISETPADKTAEKFIAKMRDDLRHLAESKEMSLTVYNKDDDESPLYKVVSKKKVFIANLIRYGLLDPYFKIKKGMTVIQALLEDDFINGIVHLSFSHENLLRGIEKLDPYNQLKLTVIFVSYSDENPHSSEANRLLATADFNVLHCNGHSLIYEAIKNLMCGHDYNYWKKVYDYLLNRADLNAGKRGFLPLDLVIDKKDFIMLNQLIKHGAFRFSKNRTLGLLTLLWEKDQFKLLEKLIAPLNERRTQELKQELCQAFVEYLLSSKNLYFRIAQIQKILDQKNPFGRFLLASDQGFTLFTQEPKIDFLQEINAILKDANDVIEKQQKSAEAKTSLTMQASSG